MTPSAISTVPSSAPFVPTAKQNSFIKPNPHPYAIKTTSTGVLTRSNSTTQNTQSSHHSYVPSSPSHGRSPDAKTKRHRLSKSLNDESFSAPRPLPTPPDRISSSKTAQVDIGAVQDDWSTPRKSKRADAFPSGAEVTPVKLEDLPSNPKVWTPSQLSSYLTTSLRVRSGETLSLPLPVARDIANFVKESKINGRLFLRLCEQDLEAMGVNKLWQSALLTSSRNLRQNVLKGRIWGTTTDDESLPFSSEMYNSSSSSLDLPSSGPLFIESEGDSPNKIGKLRRLRSGRVRGMVESLERSGSFSSDSSFDDNGIDIDAANRYVDEESIAHSPIEMDKESRSSAVSSTNSSPVRRPLPQPPVHPSLRGFLEEEPTIEELLDTDGAVMVQKEGSWGARAWEEMDRTAGVTVKKVTTNTANSGVNNGLGMVRGSRSGGSNESSKSRDERRIVTAIFSPALEGADLAQVEQKKPEEGAVELLRFREEQLEEQIRSTGALLEVFKKRLLEVEQKVHDMEEAEKQLQKELSLRDQENNELKGQLRHNEQDLDKITPLRHKKDVVKKKPLDNLDPQSISALSQYVIIVGLGVCAVVLRVVLRKVIGRNLKT